MADHTLTGRLVLRSAPWPVMLPFTALAVAFFGAAIMAGRSGLMLMLLGIGLCGSVAGYLLDEEALEVADATPTSRPRRAGWRLAIALLPGAIAAAALLEVNRRAPDVHALRMLPVALGSIAVGAGLTAAMRNAGLPAPGDFASVVTLAAVVVTVLADPLRHWVSLKPLDAPTYPIGSAIAWGAIVLVSALVLAASVRDPGGRSARGRLRRIKIRRPGGHSPTDVGS
jgi:hypothetical protein